MLVFMRYPLNDRRAPSDAEPLCHPRRLNNVASSSVSVTPDDETKDVNSAESWGSEGQSVAPELMAHVMARAQCALVQAHGGMAKAALTRDFAKSG
jgi:hypothetical protein